MKNKWLQFKPVNIYPFQTNSDRDEFYKLAPHWERIITGLFSGNAVFLIRVLLHHQTNKNTQLSNNWILPQIHMQVFARCLCWGSKAAIKNRLSKLVCDTKKRVCYEMVMWPAPSASQWCDSSRLLLVPGPRFSRGWGGFSHYRGWRVSQTLRFALWRLFTWDSLWVACFSHSTDDSLTTQVAFFKNRWNDQNEKCHTERISASFSNVKELCFEQMLLLFPQCRCAQADLIVVCRILF